MSGIEQHIIATQVTRMSSDLTKPFHDNTYVYAYSFVLISILISRHIFCHPCIDQYLYFWIPKYTE